MRSFLLVLVTLLLAVPATAEPPGIPGTDVVYLVEDCAAAGYTLNTNCFEDLTAVSGWIGSTRQPSSGDEVVVDVGLGSFSGQYTCNGGGGWVSFRGTGRGRSVLTNATQPTISITNCSGVEFQDLTVENADATAVFIGLAATTDWTDVDIVSGAAAWNEVICPGDPDVPAGENYLWGVRIVANGTALRAECNLIWLYGVEILAKGQQAVGIQVEHRGDVRVYGSAVRVNAEGTNGAISGVRVGGPTPNPVFATAGNGKFQMHGGILSLDGAGTGASATNVWVDGQSTGTAVAYAPGTAHIAKNSASVARVVELGGGQAKAPFLWQSGSDLPLGGITSVTGKDLFVETDCDSQANCKSGGEPHLMVYDSACSDTGGTWFDLVIGKCRQDQ